MQKREEAKIGEASKLGKIRIVDLANAHSEGRIISFLEGGYDLLALSESIKEHFLALKI